MTLIKRLAVSTLAIPRGARRTVRHVTVLAAGVW
jgi:hypothetical protein